MCAAGLVVQGTALTPPSNPSHSQDGSVKIWDLGKAVKLQATLTTHTKWCVFTRVAGARVMCRSVTMVKWGGEGFLYSASQDTTINVWRADDWALCRTLKVHVPALYSSQSSTCPCRAMRTG